MSDTAFDDDRRGHRVDDERPWQPAVVAVGANLGDRLGALQLAVDSLAGTPEVTVERVSSVYETDPVGGPDQPDFLNAVLLVQTTLTPGQLLDRAQAVEAEAGRVRDVRWGPRTLDVDLIAYAEHTCSDARLTLPHPRARERAFVLVPWCEIDPHARLPEHGPVADLLAGLDTSGVRRRPELTLRAPAAPRASGAPR